MDQWFVWFRKGFQKNDPYRSLIHMGHKMFFKKTHTD